MDAAGSSETLVPIYQTTLCHIPEDHSLNMCAFRMKARVNYTCMFMLCLKKTRFGLFAQQKTANCIVTVTFRSEIRCFFFLQDIPTLLFYNSKGSYCYNGGRIVKPTTQLRLHAHCTLSWSRDRIGLEVFTAVKIQIMILWVMTLCNLVSCYQRFGV
jgi:hypothetical protein